MLSVLMLSVFMLSVLMLNVLMLNVFMLSVILPTVASPTVVTIVRKSLQPSSQKIGFRPFFRWTVKINPPPPILSNR
jgi:hypothetical protein